MKTRDSTEVVEDLKFKKNGQEYKIIDEKTKTKVLVGE